MDIGACMLLQDLSDDAFGCCTACAMAVISIPEAGCGGGQGPRRARRWYVLAQGRAGPWTIARTRMSEHCSSGLIEGSLTGGEEEGPGAQLHCVVVSGRLADCRAGHSIGGPGICRHHGPWTMGHGCCRKVDRTATSLNPSLLPGRRPVQGAHHKAAKIPSCALLPARPTPPSHARSDAIVTSHLFPRSGRVRGASTL